MKPYGLPGRRCLNGTPAQILVISYNLTTRILACLPPFYRNFDAAAW